jgi:ribosome-binding factor A
MIQNHHQEKVEAALQKVVSEFLNHEAGPSSLITVTRIAFNEKAKKALVFLSVLPSDQEEKALAFAKRKSSELRSIVKEKTNMRVLPIFDFVIDIGEKNRQLVEDISAKESLQ